jgi:hypothetical protein
MNYEGSPESDGHGGQDDAEGRAAVGLALILEGTPVLFHDARGDRQAKARPPLFGGEKGVEQPLADLGGDALAGVGHFEDDDLGFVLGERQPIASRPQGDRAIVADALGGILHQIDQDLLDLAQVGPDLTGDRGREIEPDPGLGQLARKKPMDFGERQMGGDEGEFGLVRPGEMEELVLLSGRVPPRPFRDCRDGGFFAEGRGRL